VICVRCRLTITYEGKDTVVVSDLLSSHWADDHHLPSWQDAAADARDRLWRHHPETLEMLNRMMQSGDNRAS
jgi:hypothetical protein